MRRLILHSLFLAAAPLLAQSSSSGVVLVSPPASANCPVVLTARYSAQGAVVQTGKAATHPQLGYTITFAPTSARSITKDQLTLHGLDGAQVTPAKDQPHANATEDLTTAPNAANHRFESVIYSQKLTGVQWIELDDINYADGTHWQKSANSTCLVVPSGLRLVASNIDPAPVRTFSTGNPCQASESPNSNKTQEKVATCKFHPICNN